MLRADIYIESGTYLQFRLLTEKKGCSRLLGDERVTRGNLGNGGAATFPRAVWARAHCPVASGVSDVSKSGIPRLVRMHTLHLPGGLKFDPPGSTRHWCCLLSEREVVGARARSAMVSRMWPCTTCELGAEGVVSVGRTGGGSSGLSSRGAAVGGTCD